MSYSFLDENFLKQCGVADWGYTEQSKAQSYDHFQNWVEKGDVGVLSYLEGERGQKRKDLKDYMPEFESALVFLFPYSQTKKNLEAINSQYKIASYVFGFEGEDYHHFLRRKLSLIKDKIALDIPGVDIKFTLDTQPVLERDLAYRSGLGWFGKNSMLISREHGSYFIIGSLLLNKKLDLQTRSISPDHCGTCTDCIAHCPTDAINDDKTIIADKCVSTYTIEVFKDVPAPDGYENSNGEIFGCDICQEVCPWNIKALKEMVPQKIEHKLIDFFYERDKEEILSDLDKMSNREFRREFKGTPLERTGRVGLMKNFKL